jgi:DNA-nicking Smr family endonuclease
MARRGQLTETDIGEWANYTQLVRPLRGRVRLSPPELRTTPAEPTPIVPLALPPSSPPGSKFVAVGDQPGGLDKSSWNKFRTGKMPTMRTLDLHGRTAQRAFHALQSFLHAAHADHVRCVEVITGRGAGESGGVLRRELPLWLNLPTLRPMVLAASHPHAANPGSVRILLRRPR